MTSNTGFSAFEEHYFTALDRRSRQITVVEYNRHGGLYSHFSGSIPFGFKQFYLMGELSLEFMLHCGEELDWDGFPAKHQLRRFRLMTEYTDPSFETAGDGTVGILHGFFRDGRYPVDIFVSGQPYSFD